MSNQDEAIIVQEQGRDVIVSELGFIREFAELHTSPRITISSFIDDSPLYRKVQVSGFLSDRFQVLMNIEIMFEISDKLTINRFSIPELYVTEISEINQLDDGRFRLKFSNTWKIETDRVKTLLAGGISVSELVKEFIKNDDGISGFNEFIEWRERRDR